MRHVDLLTGALLSAAVLLAGCGDAVSAAADRGDFAGLVEIGDGREIYLECHGSGSPTVVLVAGGFEAGFIWDYALYPTDPVHEEAIDGFSAGRGDPQKLESAVLPTVGKLTRVCAYDRPNTVLGEDIQLERHGKISTPVDQPHSIEQDIADLHALLTAAGEPGPYVLVGHSYGGLIVALYSSTYPDDVVGNVYVDATSVYLQETLPPDAFAALIASARTPIQPGGEAIFLGEAIEVASQGTISSMPVVVLGSDKPADLSPETLKLFPDLVRAQQLLAEHHCAQLLPRTNSGHHIQVEQPQLVSDATRVVVEAARKGCSILPCDGVPPAPDPLVVPPACSNGSLTADGAR